MDTIDQVLAIWAAAGTITTIVAMTRKRSGDDAWTAGFQTGVDHALGQVARATEKLRGKTKLSIHDVEVALREERRRVEKSLDET